MCVPHLPFDAPATTDKSPTLRKASTQATQTRGTVFDFADSWFRATLPRPAQVESLKLTLFPMTESHISSRAIERYFQRYAVGYHFFARDLRTGEEIEFGERRPYPIGSCFKLAVLDAYFDPPTSVATLDDYVLVAPDQFSPGGGILNYFDSELRLTVLQLLQLMLVVSDGTATDILISRMGLEKVNAALRRYAPSSDLKVNLGNMVRLFQAMPNSAHCKTGLTEGAAKALLQATAALGATHGGDLAALALGVFQKKVSEPLQSHYRRCLKTGRLHPRTSLFIATPHLFGKTGSLGSRYFLNDCGVFLDSCDSPLVHFGYASYGWRLPSHVVETVAGLIGIEIAHAFQLPVTISPSLCFETVGAFFDD